MAVDRPAAVRVFGYIVAGVNLFRLIRQITSDRFHHVA